MKKALIALLIIAAIGVGGYIGVKLAMNTGGGGGSAGNDKIRQGVEDVIKDDDYIAAETETRGRMIEEYLYDAADKGVTDSSGNTIVKESIERDEENDLCLYVDTDGGFNVIQYARDDSFELEEDFSAGGGNGDISDTNGVILFGLDEPDSASAKNQERVAQQLRDQGSDCEIDTDVTVEEYKTELAGHNYVIIRTHGSMLNYGYGLKNQSSTKVPVLCTKEEITSSNLKAYDDDIKSQRIAKVTVIADPKTGATEQCYWIMPSFFYEYYGSEGLEGTYIHMGNCCGFGSSHTVNGDVDYTLADAFLSCGADAVTGFYNEVFSGYGTDMICSIMSSMFAGDTLEEAVDTAMRKYGSDDREYASKKGWLNTDSPYYKSATEKLNKGTARIIIYGDRNLTFYFMPTLQVVGSWIDMEKREEYGDGLLWDDEVRFFEDGTGELARSGGVERFNYTVSGPEVTINIIDGEPRTYYGYISDDNTTLTIHYLDEYNDSYQEFIYQW